MSLYTSLKKTATHILAPVALATTLAYATADAKVAYDDSVFLMQQQTIEKTYAAPDSLDSIIGDDTREALGALREMKQSKIQSRLEHVVVRFNEALTDGKLTYTEREKIREEIKSIEHQYSETAVPKHIQILYDSLGTPQSAQQYLDDNNVTGVEVLRTLGDVFDPMTDTYDTPPRETTGDANKSRDRISAFEIVALCGLVGVIGFAVYVNSNDTPERAFGDALERAAKRRESERNKNY